MNNNLTEEDLAAIRRAEQIENLKKSYYIQKTKADTHNGYIKNYKSFKEYLIIFQGVLVNDLKTKISSAQNYYLSGGYKLEDGTTLDSGLLQSLLKGIDDINKEIITILEYIDNKIIDLQRFYDIYDARVQSIKNTLRNSYGVSV